MAWTDQEDKKLREMWASGHTVSAISKDLSKTPSAVKARRKRLKLTPRRTGDLTEKVRVGFHADTMSLFRAKAKRAGQTIPARIRSLVEKDLQAP